MDGGEEVASAVKPLPTSITTDNPGGSATTSATSGIDLSATNGFFHNFGTNGRTCGTCHKVDQGWSFASAAIASLPASDPIFVFDGSDCLAPGQANPNPTMKSTALLRQGLIRVELPILDSADYTLTAYTDPFGCGSDPRVTKVLRLYRRPLPTANAKYLTTVMWDGREGGLPLAGERRDARTRAGDRRARREHGRRDRRLRSGLVHRSVGGGQLAADQARLQGRQRRRRLPHEQRAVQRRHQRRLLAPSFTPIVFTMYQSWEAGTNAPHPYAASIGRGEALFNSKPITIAGVNGLNAPAGRRRRRSSAPAARVTTRPTSATTRCRWPSTSASRARARPRRRRACRPTRTQQGDAAGVDHADRSGARPHQRKVRRLGKTKGPILRGLAARAPYFHNGSAADLGAVVDFYNARFGIGFTAAEKADLVAFLGAL